MKITTISETSDLKHCVQEMIDKFHLTKKEISQEFTDLSYKIFYPNDFMVRYVFSIKGDQKRFWVDIYDANTTNNVVGEGHINQPALYEISTTTENEYYIGKSLEDFKKDLQVVLTTQGLE